MAAAADPSLSRFPMDAKSSAAQAKQEDQDRRALRRVSPGSPSIAGPFSSRGLPRNILTPEGRISSCPSCGAEARQSNNTTAPDCAGAVGLAYPAEMVALVAGYCCFSFGLFDFGCAVTVCVAIAIRRGDLHWLHRYAGNRAEDLLHRANLHDGLGGLLQHELFVNAANLGGLFERLLAANTVFFGRGHRNVVFQVANARGVFGINAERVLVALQIDLLAFGEDVVLAVFLVPLGDGRVLVHVLDDFAPAHAGVVRAEGNLTLLRGVGNDAHFGAAEIVIEKVLEPHAGDKQEVPRIFLAALHGIFERAVA